jgi:hypothetical protein
MARMRRFEKMDEKLSVFGKKKSNLVVSC